MCVFMPIQIASEGRTSVATGVWPPPKPPEGTKLTSNLPSNLHMASASDGSAAEDKQAAREDGSTQTRGELSSVSVAHGGAATQQRAQLVREDQAPEARRPDPTFAGDRCRCLHLLVISLASCCCHLAEFADVLFLLCFVTC